MATKLAILLVVVGACMAFPSEEQPKPPQLSVNAPGPVDTLDPHHHEPHQDEPLQNEPDHHEPDQHEPDHHEPDQHEPLQNEPDHHESHQEHQEPPAALQKEDKDDLKTDNTFWWGRSYYPVYHHYRPRYYYYPRTYHYVSPYWW